MAKKIHQVPEPTTTEEVRPAFPTLDELRDAGIEAELPSDLSALPTPKSREQLLAIYSSRFADALRSRVTNRALVSLAVRRAMEALSLLPASAGPLKFLVRAVAVAVECCEAQNDEDAAASIPAARALLKERARIEEQERERVGKEASVPAGAGLPDGYALAKHLLACVLQFQDSGRAALVDEAAEVAIELLQLREQGQSDSIRRDLQQSFEEVVDSDLLAFSNFLFEGAFPPDDPDLGPLWGGHEADQAGEGKEAAGSLTTSEEAATVGEVISPSQPERKKGSEDAGSQDLSSASMAANPLPRDVPLEHAKGTERLGPDTEVSGGFSAAVLLLNIEEMEKDYDCFVRSSQPEKVVALQARLDRLSQQRGLSYEENFKLAKAIDRIAEKYHIDLLYTGEYRGTTFTDEVVYLRVDKPKSKTGRFRLVLPGEGSPPAYIGVLAPSLKARARDLNAHPLTPPAEQIESNSQ